MKRIHAISLLIALVFSQPLNAVAQQANASEGQRAEAMTAFSTIVELARNADARDIQRLAANLHFSYQSLGCHPTNEFSDFCQYQVDNRNPEWGNILILALAHDKVSGKTGGRVIWSAPQDGKCLQKEKVLSLLGPGKSRIDNISEPIPGGTAAPVESEEYLHRSIRGATALASAVISYRNNCVNQMFLDF